MTLGTRDLCAQYAQNRGTDFRNFDFRIFGKFLKFYVWASVSAKAAAWLSRPTSLSTYLTWL